MDYFIQINDKTPTKKYERMTSPYPFTLTNGNK